jgi:4-oxalmesaconate hydratase
MVGAVRGIDPETGHYFDDTKRYIDGISWLSAADKRKIFELNARQVYARIAAHINEGVATSPPTLPAVLRVEAQ